MPLSREKCEALAEAYPEVRAHKFQTRDLFYPSAGYQEDFECGPNDGPFPVWMEKAHGSRVHEGLPDADSVWVPRLDDLLELAGGIAVNSHQCIFFQIPDCLVSYFKLAHGVTRRWLYGREGRMFLPPEERGARGEDDGTHGEGATPEEAVANWLIARAGEVRT